MREYPSFVAGLRYEGRGRCAEHLRVGDHLVFRPEPDNPVSADAVTVSPASSPQVVIGYVPHEHDWIKRAIVEKGTHLDAVVTEMDCDAFGAWRVWMMVKVWHAEEAAAVPPYGQE